MTDADYSFEVPEFEDFTGAGNDQADKWFDERRCTSMKKRKVHSGGAQSKAKPKTAIARVKAAAKGIRKAKNVVRAREAVVLPIRSEAPLTIPDTPEVLKKSKPKMGAKFVSVAESVAQFANRTPPRFRVAPATCKFRPQPAGPRLRVTKPQSPNFQPRRARHRIVPSTAEMEENMMKSIKPFKAQPLSREVLESKGDLGVPRVPARDVTVPVEFKFETDKRLELRPKPTIEEPAPFTAHPAPQHILQGGPVGVPEKKRKAPTVAHSPKLTKPVTRPETREPSDDEEPPVEFHARPMPVAEQVFKPQLPHKHTEPVPFKVAAKDPKVRRQQLLEEQMRREAEQREFKASGLPSLSPAPLPAVESKPATVAEPFELPGDRISSRKRMDFAEKKLKAQSEAIAAMQFHAQPCMSTTTLPFEPKRAAKPLTEITQFELATDKRAVERNQFEETLREKERIRLEQEEAAEQQRRLQEMKEIKEMRRHREHKAQPIRHYKPVSPAPQLPLTEPQSPAFSMKGIRA